MSYFDCTPAIEFRMGDGQWQADFWTEMGEAYDQEVRNAVGCYIMTTEGPRGGNPTAWYVGKTEASFANEVFTPHKQAKYRAVLEKKPNNVRAKLLLYPLLTDERQVYARPSPCIDWLENRLIVAALSSNPAIQNVSMTRNDREIEVYGFNAHRQRQGPRYGDENYSLRVLGLNGAR